MRAGRAIDAGRLSSLVSRPGIDPRVWLSLGVVEEIGFNAAEGTFVDLRMQPSGEVETAYLGSTYAGNQFGDHCPVEVGDTVMVAIPSGDPGMGPVIVCRWCNSGDPPHPEVGAAEKTSRVVRAKPGERVVLRTSAAGMVSIVAEGPADVELTSLGGMVQLGNAAPGAPAVDFVALSALVLAQLTALQTQINAFITIYDSHTHITGVPTHPTGPAVPPGIPVLPPQPVAATKVRAT